MGQIDITIGREIGDEIQRIADRLPQAIMEFLDDVASSVEVLMKDEAPVVLGDLQNSITTDNVSPLERLVWPTVEHAAFVILGTRPHLIEAVNAKALGPFAFGSYLGVSFGGYAKGGEQFFVSVHHPGTSPNDFPSRAADRAEDIIESRLDTFYNNLFE